MRAQRADSTQSLQPTHRCTVAAGIVMFCVLLMAIVSPAWAAECEKTVRWRHDPPYAWQEANGNLTGQHVELTRVVLDRLGCQARFIEMPWARALLDLEEGRLDILPGALRTPERSRFAFFSRAINNSPNLLFMRKDARQRYRFRKLADLIGSDFRLGAQIKVAYGPEYDMLLPDPAFAAQLTMITDRRSAWKMIQADRIDGLIADQITGAIELQELGLSELVVATDLVVSDDTSHIALSRRSVDARFAEQFDQALENLYRDGTAQAIAQRFLPCKVAANGLHCR